MKENVSVVLGRVGNWVQGTPLNSFSSCLTVFRLLNIKVMEFYSYGMSRIFLFKAFIVQQSLPLAIPF